MSGLSQNASAGGTGTGVGPSAEINDHSRLMSCALGSSLPCGGRRITAFLPSASSSR